MAKVPTIRRATEADHSELMKLMNAYDGEVHVYIPENPESLRKALRFPQPELGFFVAEMDGKMVGCVMSRDIGMPKSVEVKRLFVNPNYRGYRIAQLLMDALESAAADAGREWATLGTRGDLKAAVAMYHKRGYELCEKYDDNPKTTHYFRKSLKGKKYQAPASHM